MPTNHNRDGAVAVARTTLDRLAQENALALLAQFNGDGENALARAVVRLAQASRKRENAHLRPAVAFLVTYLQLEESTR